MKLYALVASSPLRNTVALLLACIVASATLVAQQPGVHPVSGRV